MTNQIDKLNSGDAPAKSEPKHRQTTMKVSEWEPLFLAQLRLHGVIGYAAKTIGIGRSTVYRRKAKSARFAAKITEALADVKDILHVRAHTVAMAGDPGMIKWMLAHLDPETFGTKALEGGDADERQRKPDLGDLTLNDLRKLRALTQEIKGEAPITIETPIELRLNRPSDNGVSE